MSRRVLTGMFLLFVLITIVAAAGARSNSSVPAAPGPGSAEAKASMIDADVFCGPNNEPRKAVILLGGSEGGKSWSRNSRAIASLVEAGYCAVPVAYFGEPGLPRHLQEIPLEYFENVFDWLAARPDLVPNAYAVIGGSRGGELALLLASRYAQVRAVVALAPSHVVFQGKPSDLLDALRGPHAAWTSRGQAVPFVSIPLSLTTFEGMLSGNQVAMHNQALADATAVDRAAIPVEDSHGPILCVSNFDDQVWPSTYMCDQVIERLAAKGFIFRYQHLSYTGGHNSCDLRCWSEVLSFVEDEFGAAYRWTDQQSVGSNE